MIGASRPGGPAMLEIVPREQDLMNEALEPSTAARQQDLLDRVARGDRQAFSELYDEVAPRVFGLVKRLLRDPSQSEEVTQEIFLEIWQTAGRFDPNKGGATTWILTMAHRRAVDRVRASQASRVRDVRIGIRDMDAEYDHVAESAETKIEHERVERAMSRLTDLQRQAIALSYYGGYSNSEVAELLHVPIGTIKTRIRDGMIRLRDELGVAS
jgi:RNA polymerase sigma-70 factor (ECF subfamily)